MLYAGIDYHKRYSVVSTQDATSARICEARIDDNEPAAFAAYFERLPEPSRVVVESGQKGSSGTSVQNSVKESGAALREGNDCG